MDPRASGRLEDCASPSELIEAIEQCPHTCVEVSRKTYLMVCALRGETVLHSYAQTFILYIVDLRQEIPLWKELLSTAVAKRLNH
jgi:hypothetical protein